MGNLCCDNKRSYFLFLVDFFRPSSKNNLIVRSDYAPEKGKNKGAIKCLVIKQNYHGNNLFVIATNLICINFTTL